MKPRRYPAHRNPVAAAILRARIRQDMANLKTTAALQAWNGEHLPNLINSAGRLVYIVLAAAEACGYKADHPDMRVCMGMGEALGDLGQDKRLEFHRPAIQSGLLAIERLLPTLSDWAMGNAAIQLDQLLKAPQGMGTEDLRAIFERRAA